ncbi:MAG: molybdenum cofactor guanylyltransferase [Gemmatimonadaceae bacterium]|nr:molybdenum cofactor guanylyltransferase [Gemmatimonadaceae bacterium]
MVPITSQDITAIVLCGGEGRRMGGADKPLVLFRGMPLVQHVIDGLHHAVGDIVIVANRSFDAYRALGYRVILDEKTGLGPLGGIAAAAPHVTTPWAFICAGDTPFIESALVKRLADHASAESRVARVAHDGERLQPLFALVSDSVLATAPNHLESQSLSVREWLVSQGAVAVDATDLGACMISIDNPEQLRALELRAP